MRLCLIALTLTLAACVEQQPSPPDALPRRAPPAAARSGLDGPPRLDASTENAPFTGDSVLVGDPPTLVPGPRGQLPSDWTVRSAKVATAREGAATLHTVRTGAHDGFDRIVFAFDGGTLPGVHLEYVDRPVHACGSGEEIRLAGEGWLEVRFEPALAHTEAGAATVSDRRQAPALAALREWALICDFEADVTVVLGLAAPAGYRTAIHDDPLRLVVDVRHGR